MDLVVIQGLSHQIVITLWRLEGPDQLDLGLANALYHTELISQPCSHGVIVPFPTPELLIARHQWLREVLGEQEVCLGI